MRAWRIALRKFAKSPQMAFSGLSGFSADGRWHSAGRHLDYAAESLSLAILERLVHYKRFDVLEPHVLFTLDIPQSAINTVAELPDGWDAEDPLTAAQTVGNTWCDSEESPALLVPSAVTPGEHNLMLNSHHPDWRWQWVISGPQAFAFDARLAELMNKNT
jgi:RES domain-containing protein